RCRRACAGGGMSVPTGDRVRWNKFVPVNDSDSTLLIRNSGSDPQTDVHAIATTPLFQQVRGRFTSFMVPFGLAAAFFGPATETGRRRSRLSASTNAPFVVFAEDFEEAWHLHAELLTADEVRELENLWALQYPGPLGTDFRIFE